MDKPAKLSFSDEATFTFTRGVVVVPLGVTAFSFFLALVTSDTTLSDLTLPCAGVIAIWVIWVGILWVGSRGYRISEILSINRMFAGEIWECWQFNQSEWQALVEAESNLISPKDEGLEAYSGVVASSIYGAILAIILLVVVQFAIKDPDIKPVMRITAVAIFLLLVGIGLFQPVYERYQAYRYRRKALRVVEPRVWFASDGIYHEALGHTSLKELEKVTDQTRSRKAIQFTLTASTESTIYLVAIPFPVPSDCEERAGKLVHRYRQERLHKRPS